MENYLLINFHLPHSDGSKTDACQLKVEVCLQSTCFLKTDLHRNRITDCQNFKNFSEFYFAAI